MVKSPLKIAPSRTEAETMDRPAVDLSKVVAHLVGPRALAVLLDANLQPISVFGDVEALGFMLTPAVAPPHVFPVDVDRYTVPGDRPGFLATLQRASITNDWNIRSSVRIVADTGQELNVDLQVHDLRGTSDNVAFLLEIVDVSERERRRERQERSLVGIQLQGAITKAVANSPLKVLSGTIRDQLGSVSGAWAADFLQLSVLGPSGRGRLWTWTHDGCHITEVSPSSAVKSNRLNRNQTQQIPAVVYRRAPGQTPPTDFGDCSVETAVSVAEWWGGGMCTELHVGWTAGPSSEAVRDVIGDASLILSSFQHGLGRLASDAIAVSERFRAATVFKQLSDFVAVWSADLRLTFCTNSFAAAFGSQPDDMLGCNLADLLNDDNKVSALQSLAPGKSTERTDLPMRTATSDQRFMNVVTTNLCREEYVSGYLMTGRDITESLRISALHARKEALAGVIASISSRFVNATTASTNASIRAALADVASYCHVERILVWQEDQKGNIRVTHEQTAANVASIAGDVPSIPADLTRSMLGDSLHGKVELLRADGPGAAFIQAISADGPRKLGAVLVVGLPGSDGSIGLLTFSAQFDDQGAIPGLSELESEETQSALLTVGELLANALNRAAAESALIYTASHDALTGLVNRHLLLERTDRMLTSALPAGRGVGLIVLDLDDFKTVNDTLGHEVGDGLLRDVAGRLRGLRTGSAVVARPGGDEFVILIEADDPHAAVHATTDRIFEELGKVFRVADRTLVVRVSIGAVIVEATADALPTGGDLIRRADMAMYAAKKKGGNSFELFSDSLEDQTRRRFNLHDELREAIENDQLELWFQPQVKLGSRTITGCEALVRWRHPTKGFVLPNEFIGAAEQAGLISALGTWVFRRAVNTMARLRQGGLVPPDFSIAVNVSSQQLVDADLAKQFAAAAWDSGQDPSSFTIELTESTLAERDRVIPTLVALRDAGFRTSIDDFGTGYSSLSYLRDLPLDELKIDRSFVTSIEVERRDLDMVWALVEMAHSLGLIVVAEGVETEGQRRLLDTMGCNIGQGWLFSKALPADEFVQLMQQSADFVLTR